MALLTDRNSHATNGISDLSSLNFVLSEKMVFVNPFLLNLNIKTFLIDF